ncbi:MAG: hypothetical protein NZ736_06560, partial [Candidatus Poseidoniaceae archaeon]|nr:hypothetical protein [Candidatus Poseidoniaceae archaeon]
MREYVKPATSANFRPIFVALLMLISSLALIASPVQATGPNQNDMGSGGDSSDNTTNAVNYIFTGHLSGTGELDINDDHDWLRVSLNSNQGVTMRLSFNSTTTLPNGTTTVNDFDLSLYDNTSQNLISNSWQSNPEMVTTNGSTVAHNGLVYLDISRYSGVGSWSLDIWKFAVSSGNGTGGNGTSVPANCAGNNTLLSDILEPNDSQATATLASVLPVSCTGLSIHSTTDVDYFEVQMVAGVTYYANITFLHSNGDIDCSWETVSGGFLASSGSVSDNEAMSYSSTSNQTTYIRVYGWSSAINTYDIDITTSNPGGGQSMESIDVTTTGLTTAMITFSGLSVGSNYNYNYSSAQVILDGSISWSTSTNVSFNATASIMTHNVSVSQPQYVESEYYIVSYFKDSTGGNIAYDDDYTYIEMVEVTTSSSTTGEISLTNLSIGTDYYLEWFVVDQVVFENSYNVSMDVYTALNASTIDTDYTSFNATATSLTTQLNWTGPTTLNDHFFAVILSYNNTATNHSTGSGWIGFHDEEFTPQLPTLLIDSHSTSSTSSTNDVSVKGYDLITG